MKKTKIIMCGSAAGLLVLLIAGIIIAAVNGKDEVLYRETQAVKGNLTVGITEKGNVSIGTSEQTFDLDISEYTGGTVFSFENSMGGGMMQIFQSEETSGSTSGRTLEIEEVYITAGQEIEKGTPILKLSEESVKSIRQELEEDGADAQITYEQAKTSQKQAELQAQADMDSNRAYGSYAEAEYTKTVNTLTQSAEDIQEQITEAQEELEKKTAEHEEMQVFLTEQQKVLKNAEYSRDNTSREDALYWWITAVNTVTDMKELIETLEDEMESTEERIETQKEEITSLKTKLALANKELLAGKIEAENQKELRQFHYDSAEEIYDITLSQSSFETENAREDYELALEKLDKFDSIIQDSKVLAEYSGIVTEVAAAKGDTLEQNSSIITLNNYSEATITVSVDEGDMEAAGVGNAVNIIFSAFPDEVFAGEVTEIGDAEINSNTNTTAYSVTVTITEDVSSLYEGMSAEITFITKQSEEVIYISNRAVIRDGDTSYVKVKDSMGNIVTQKVVTGFSDGINVEVKEGLAEGNTVLIER